MTIEEKIKGMSMPQYLVATYVLTGALITIGLAFRK